MEIQWVLDARGSTKGKGLVGTLTRGKLHPEVAVTHWIQIHRNLVFVEQLDILREHSRCEITNQYKIRTVCEGSSQKSLVKK